MTTPKSEQSAEEPPGGVQRARDRALTLWRLRGTGDEFHIYLQLCSEVEEFRLTNQRLEAITEGQRKMLADSEAENKRLEAEVERMKELLDKVVFAFTMIRETKPEMRHLGKEVKWCAYCRHGMGGHGGDCLVEQIENYLRELSSREQKGERQIP